MSELEIRRRKEYKQNRKRWMIVQVVAIVLLGVIALGSFLVYNRMDRTYYVECTENSVIDYKVQYAENGFFEEEWVGKDQAYISSLINSMTADFSYRLDANSKDLDFSYKYKIDAILVIASKDNGNSYYTYEENIFPPKDAGVKNSSRVSVSESVSIDYVKYNQMAKDFVNTYGLDKSASCTLTVKFEINVLSTNKQFEKESSTLYNTALNIPLAVDTFSVYTTSSSPANEVKVLEYQDTVNRELFTGISASAAAIDVVLALALVIFLQLTKNEDITYAAKIRKILRSYGTYIQRIDGEFSDAGYQTVMIKSFTEMLGIRDTIQSPVLMSENHDETMTRFLIPTNTQLLYIFEIKVDNYDAIYGKPEPEIPPFDPTIDVEVTNVETVVEIVDIVTYPCGKKTKSKARAKATSKAKAKAKGQVSPGEYLTAMAEAEYEIEIDTNSEADK